MDDELNKIVTVMQQKYRKDISVYDKDFLEKSIEKRILETKSINLAEYAHCIGKDSGEAEALYGSLHISFSQFFRDPVTFAALEQSIFPGISANIREGREIRIWSAGCANGQEAYSIAISLSDFANTVGKEIRFRIFATDISQEALSAGKAGIYDESMILNLKEKYLRKYFTKQGKNYIISPKIQEHINFSLYDLLDQSTANLPESIFGDFDIVICSNVLIYYNQEVQQAIIEKLLHSLSPLGYLVTGEAEKTLIQDGTKLQSTTLSAAVFSNKKRRSTG